MTGTSVMGRITGVDGSEMRLLKQEGETFLDANGQLSSPNARPQGMEGQPWIELSPDSSPVQPKAPQSEDGDIAGMLNREFDARGAEMESFFTSQEEPLHQQFQSMLDNLEGEYEIERRYLEESEMDGGLRNEQVRKLNVKYEKQIYKLKAEAQPDLIQLRQKRDAAAFALESKRADGFRRIQFVKELVASGKVTDEAGALQETLQAVGLNIPLSALKGPEQQQRNLGSIKAELQAVNTALGGYLTPKAKGEKKPTLQLTPEGVIPMNVMVSPNGSWQNARPATHSERQHAHLLLAAQGQLRQELFEALTSKNAGPLQRGMATAGGIQGNPFAQKIADQMPKPKSSQAAKYMTNKRTGQRVVSYDGGNTWQPVTN